MARTNAPVQSTYETKRISFVNTPQQRSGLTPTKDARLINMMVENLNSPEKEVPRSVVRSRPGTTTAYTNTAGVGRGIFYWVYSGTGYTFSVIGASVYVNGVLKQTLTTSTGNCGFTEYLNDVGTRQLVLLDGTNGYIWTNPANAPEPIIPPVWVTVTAYATGTRRKPTVSNNFFYEATTGGTTAAGEPAWPVIEGNTVVDGTVTWTCRGGSFPSPHIANPIFLDGYLVVAKANTADVYTSNLNNPLSWTAGDFITAEMYPDPLVALSKNNFYVYAIGSSSIEFFFDAANATGTPLGRHDSAVQQFGAVAQGTIVPTEIEVILVGETGNGGHTVWTLEGFTAKEIGIPSVKQALLEEGSSLANATAYCIRVNSQKLYVLCLSSRTFVYSFDTKFWHEWDSGATGSSTFMANWGADGPYGTASLLGKTSGKTYRMGEDFYDDSGTNFQCQIVTPKYDFETYNVKFMHRLSIIGETPDDTGVDNTLSIEWSDDDYKTWQTARTLSFNNDFACITQLGRFRRRAFRFKYAKPHLLRFDGIEVDINKGSR